MRRIGFDGSDRSLESALAGTNPTRIFKKSNVGRRITSQFHSGVGMRSTMMSKITASVVA